ncbi:sporulation protein YqfD [Paenibacillus glycanilyticus]|uniref:sporulation protein YqfD n=1 Tax=Paenibacillus glycanilyticus TaxID=126569 RepID=UPI00203D1EF2|nr:sporulation protein YqfD [Paenibacillus glycanilyticus]MCM3627276.1 sporulation protein YqfD [Paenibacillus glycanilyticus]
MAGQWLQWIRGVVTVHIRGGQPERLVNRALEGGLELSSIRWTSDKLLEFELSVGDFFRLRPFLKETGCRAHVTKREGMPFWLVRIEKRKFFAIGIGLFFIGIYLLSSLVWSVEVKGNVKLTEEQVLKAAKSEGIFPMQWSFRLKDKDQLAKELVTDLPGATWVGVEKKGTRIVIEIVEATEPEKVDLQNPRHLIASNDAVITEIYTEKGRPVVKKNMKVKKGQTLISGTIGGGAYTKSVVAKGSVRGLVWYEFNVVSPLAQEVKVYTGEKKTKWYAVFGSRALQVSGYGKNPFDSSEDVVVEEKAVWRSWKLPFGRLKKTIMEVRTDVRELTDEEAKNNGMLQAKSDVMLKAGNDAVILKEIVLHEKTDNGKVYMKVLFEVEQSIVEEMPLVQMQGE